MNKIIDNPQRRRTLFATIAVIVTTSLGKFFPATRAEATELPHLTEDDSTAKILN